MPKLHIAHATIKRASHLLPFDTFENAMEESWTPGAQVVRYGRLWRLTRRVSVADGLWGGRIGFVKDDTSSAYWDEVANDFHNLTISAAVVVPFIINIPRRLVSFQFSPSKSVKVNTVTGNLQALLNVRRGHRWNVVPLSSAKQDYRIWRDSVVGVSQMKATLLLPNPGKL